MNPKRANPNDLKLLRFSECVKTHSQDTKTFFASWAANTLPRGFSIPCGFALAPGRSSPRRELCERAGLLYRVVGSVGEISIPLCPRHKGRLLRDGFLVGLAPPIAQEIARGMSRNFKPNRAFPTQRELIA